MVLARGAATIATVGQEETAVAMSELEMLQRDIDDLLDTNRLDWLGLANR